MPRLLNNRGEAKMSLGDDEGAILDFGKALKFNPKLVDAYTNRGLSGVQCGRLARCRFRFFKSPGIGARGSPTSTLTAAWPSKAELGEFVEAIDDYTKAIEIWTKPTRSLYNYRGVAHYNGGNSMQAIADYDEAIKLESKRPADVRVRALALRRKAGF